MNSQSRYFDAVLCIQQSVGTISAGTERGIHCCVFSSNLDRDMNPIAAVQVMYLFRALICDGILAETNPVNR
jgi:hypothetical protein